MSFDLIHPYSVPIGTKEPLVGSLGAMPFGKAGSYCTGDWRWDEMSNFRNVSSSEPCPICGKPDWCSVQYVEGGHKLHYCRRVLNGDNIIGSTGETFIFIKRASDGSCIYKEEGAYQASREEWLRNNNNMGVQRTAFKANAVPAPPAPSSSCVESIPPLENEKLDKIYRSFLGMLSLKKPHMQYLFRQGWPADLIISSKIKSMPAYSMSSSFEDSRHRIAAELIREVGSLEGVPGFFTESDGKWTFAGASGLLIPLYDQNGNMYRLRLRLDHPELDENGKEKNKYNNFSSYKEASSSDGSLHNAYLNGCRSGSHIGLYENPSKDDYTVCYITEGEKKSIYANYILHNPIISIPGVNSFKKLLEPDGNSGFLNYLSSKGCRVIVIAYDSDKCVNEAVLMYETRLSQLLLGKGFQIALASWNPGFGKGLDDILSINVRPTYELVRA